MKLIQNLNASVQKLELNGSGWVYDSIARLNFDLTEGTTKSGNSFIELPKECLSILHIQMIINVEFGI